MKINFCKRALVVSGKAKKYKSIVLYARSIISILKQEGGKTWWKLFGFSRDLPEKLEIHAVPMIPKALFDSYNKECEALGLKHSDKIQGPDWEIQTGYILFSGTGKEIKITDSLL